MWQILILLASVFVCFVLLTIIFLYCLADDRSDYEVRNYIDIMKMSRRLGFMEKYFLAAEVRNVGTITTVLLLESTVKLSKESLRSALLMAMRRFPMLRMCVKEKHKQLYLEELDFTQMMDFCIIDQDADNWREAFEKQLNGKLFDTARGPLWRVVLLKEACYKCTTNRYRNALMFTFHHLIGDALSIFELIKKLFEYLELVYNKQSYEDERLLFRPPIENLIVHLIKPTIWEKVISVGTSFVSRTLSPFIHRKPRNLYLSVFPPPNDRPLTKMTCTLTRSFSVEETVRVVKCSKANKCTVHGAITAATHLVMTRLLQRKQELKTPLLLSSSYTVKIRNECRPKIGSEEFGNYATLNLLQMSAPPETNSEKYSFWDFARTCTSEVHSSIKKGNHRNFFRLFQSADIESLCDHFDYEADKGFKQELFNLTNLGSIQIHQNEDSPYKFTGAYLALRSENIGYIFGFNMFTINDKMYWTMEYFPHLTSKMQAEEFLNSTLDVLLKASCM